VTPAPGRSAVRHVLFDADGVEQDAAAWWEALVPRPGDERARAFPRGCGPTSGPRSPARRLPERGRRAAGGVRPGGADAVPRAGVGGITVDRGSRMLVDALRAAGYGVHLGTNQDPCGAAHMRGALRYDALFDVSCHSCDLGVAKPGPAFFTEAARRIGARPGAVLFVDDRLGNIEAARLTGLRAEQWNPPRDTTGCAPCSPDTESCERVRDRDGPPGAAPVAGQRSGRWCGGSLRASPATPSASSSPAASTPSSRLPPVGAGTP
jgi:putative hydrolase of the HAD superfamily